MNTSDQNYILPEYLRTGPDYGGYSTRPDRRNRMPSLVPLYQPAGGPLDPRGGDHDPWWFFRERVPGGPLGISSFPAPPYIHNPTQFLDNVTTRNTRPRQPAADASPSFQRQPSLQASGEESKLTQEEQKKTLNKLKIEIYNPVPKWLTRKPNLYYRDNPITISREAEKEQDEEGKRCAICLDDFEPKEMVAVTPCNHMFHEECIVPWVKTQGRCPVCRFAMMKF